MKIQSKHLKTEAVQTQQDILPNIFTQTPKDISFLTGTRVTNAPILKLQQNKIFHNKKFSLDSLQNHISPTTQTTLNRKSQHNIDKGSLWYFNQNKNKNQHIHQIKLSNLLSPCPITQQLSNQQESINAEESQSKFPDFSDDNRFQSTFISRKRKKAEIHRISLDNILQQNKLFVLKADIFDLTQYKFSLLSRNQYQHITDQYYKRQKIIQYLQKQMDISEDYHQLFLANQYPFQFFEEIPQSINLIFLGKHTKCEFWIQLSQIHKMKIKQKGQYINKIINSLSQIKNFKNLNDFIFHKATFEKILHNSIYIDNFQPFLFLTEPKKLEKYYLDDKEMQQNEILEGLKQNCKKMKKKNKLNRNDSQESSGEYDDDNVDFTLRQIEYPSNIFYSVQIQSQARRLKNYSFKTKQKGFKKKDLRAKIFDLKERNIIFLRVNLMWKRISIKFNQICLLRNKDININRILSKKYPLMMSQNIPHLLKKTGFSRQELHEIFARYKALLGLQCQDIPGLSEKNMPSGIDFNTFYNGLEEMSMAPFGVLDQLFINFAKSQSLDFEGFLNVVNLIKAKKTEDKITLILKLMDEDENGLLSFDEIVDRCNKMLDEMLAKDQTDLSLDSMSQYISKQIFKAVNVDEKDEIPIEKIRKLIESNSQEAQVLIMMCCGDVNYLK